MSNTGFEEAWHYADEAEGWLTKAQGAALFDAARVVGPGQWIVEIGSHCGRSTVLLAAAKHRDVKLLAVDPFEDPRWGGGPEAFERFRATLAGAGLLDDVIVFRGLSVEAAIRSQADNVGLLFIDGAHDEPSVLADIDGWGPRMAERAVVLLHDAYSSPGVTKALFRRFFGVRFALYRGSEGSLARVDMTVAGRRQRLGSMCLMAARLGWFARNLLIKITLRRQWFVLTRLLLHRGREYPY